MKNLNQTGCILIISLFWKPAEAKAAPVIDFVEVSDMKDENKIEPPHPPDKKNEKPVIKLNLNLKNTAMMTN